MQKQNLSLLLLSFSFHWLPCLPKSSGSGGPWLFILSPRHNIDCAWILHGVCVSEALSHHERSLDTLNLPSWSGHMNRLYKPKDCWGIASCCRPRVSRLLVSPELRHQNYEIEVFQLTPGPATICNLASYFELDPFSWVLSNVLAKENMGEIINEGSSFKPFLRCFVMQPRCLEQLLTVKPVSMIKPIGKNWSLSYFIKHVPLKEKYSKHQNQITIHFLLCPTLCHLLVCLISEKKFLYNLKFFLVFIWFVFFILTAQTHNFIVFCIESYFLLGDILCGVLSTA